MELRKGEYQWGVRDEKILWTDHGCSFWKVALVIFERESIASPSGSDATEALSHVSWFAHPGMVADWRRASMPR